MLTKEIRDQLIRFIKSYVASYLLAYPNQEITDSYIEGAYYYLQWTVKAHVSMDRFRHLLKIRITHLQEQKQEQTTKRVYL